MKAVWTFRADSPTSIARYWTSQQMSRAQPYETSVRKGTRIQRSSQPLHFVSRFWGNAPVTREGGRVVGRIFFEEGGRFTIGDTHYVQQGEELTPAGDTEFARDAAFGYRSSSLPAWVQEKSQGRVAAGVVGSVSIEDLRQGGPDRVAEILQGISGGRVVVANSASYRDMEVFVAGLLRACAHK